MQVATCKGGQPWTCNVWYSYDDDLNLYFISSNHRRHCEEIRNNEKISAAIVHPIYKEAGGQECRGITLEGTATELGVLSSGKALDNFMKRWPKAKKYVAKKDLIKNLTKVRFYKIKPQVIVLFDETNYPKDPRRELRLS